MSRWRANRALTFNSVAQSEIKELKAQLPTAGEDGVVPASPAGEKIAELEALRKELNKGGSLKDKHFNWGSVLLGGGVTFAIAGPLNTFLRTGKPCLSVAEVLTRCARAEYWLYL